ncbi:MAG: fimbrillin family protein [Tannerellaceae bacterium]|jgi:hypothetical protein|nr:fimbrillin family protein [Tannerellaceae bacterium]
METIIYKVNRSTFRAIAAVLLTSAGLSSCGDDAAGLLPDNHAATTPYAPIQFVVEENEIPDTRSTGDITTDNISEIAVFAYRTTNEWTTQDNLNFMNNRKVVKSGNVWNYTPPLFWGPSLFSFFAVSPQPSAASGIIPLIAANDAGYPSFTVTPPAYPTSHVDFCTAKPVMNASKQDTNGPAAGDGGGFVSFHFAHIFAQVSFSARHIYTFNNEWPEVYIDAIELSGLMGTSILRFNSAGYTLDTPNTPATYTLSVTRGELTSTKALHSSETGSDIITATEGMLCLLPQTIPAGAKLTVNYRIYDVPYVSEIPLNNGDVWQAGKRYNYQLVLDAENRVWNFPYTGTLQTLALPADGTYRFEAWGGQGGSGNRSGGLGGYVKGYNAMNKDDALYICVGQAASNNAGSTGGAGGVNPLGGSGGRGSNAYNANWPGGGGGGAASDVRTSNLNIAGLNLDNDPSLDPRIIVAGGGFGSSENAGSSTSNFGGQAGANGAGGTPPTGGTRIGTGGGGGGFRGGKGGLKVDTSWNGSSSTYDMTSPLIQPGVRSGNGYVRIILLP